MITEVIESKHRQYHIILNNEPYGVLTENGNEVSTVICLTPRKNRFIYHSVDPEISEIRNEIEKYFKENVFKK
jgi:hypothetical protein